ncbi:MAG: ribosomal RNA small subunit methyltransferase A, partial [Bacilli bacterium]|nr:ribosomal RNA small subunit methyltransferase A [Bacilli bacterium]
MIYNFDFRKSLGQNFLIDDSIVDNIANAIDYKENNMIIEIGPGSGNLTKKLLKKADFVLLYEIDTRLKKILSRELLEFNNYDIIWDDFLYRDVKEDLKKYNYKNIYIVANLPYYITTPIVSKFVMETIPANEIVIMIQKEVAERLSAPVGTKEYGQITVLLNYHFNIEKIIDVDRKAFYPTPNVDSAVIKMIRKDNLEDLTS